MTQETSAGQPQGPIRPAKAGIPRSVSAVCGLLIAEALLPIILTADVFSTRGAITARIAVAAPGLTSSQLHSRLAVRLSTDVIENGLLVAACVLLLVMIRRGHRWAWVVALVVSILLIPSALDPIVRLVLPVTTDVTLAWLGFAAGVLGIAIVVVLLLPSPRRHCSISQRRDLG